MTRLLELPVEIRTLIIKCIILSERQPTCDWSAVETYEAARAFGPDYCSRKNFDGIVYEDNDETNRPNLIGLMLTNHQLRDEVVNCLAQSGSVCKVDVAIMQGRSIWPTFTCIPLKNRRKIDVVEATIHGSGRGLPCMRGWRARDCALPQIVGPFWGLLEHFLNGGPCSPEARLAQSVRQPFRSRSGLTVVTLLDLNVTDPDSTFEESFPPNQSFCAHCRTNCNSGLTWPRIINLEPEGIHNFLRTFFRSLIYRMHYWRDGIMLTQVGSIRMHVRGMQTGEINLGAAMELIPLHHDVEEKNTWTKWAKNVRKQNGFPCSEEANRLTSSEWGPLFDEWCKNAVATKTSGQ